MTYSASTDGMVEIFVELEEWVKAPDVSWSKLQQELATAKTLDLPVANSLREPRSDWRRGG